MILHPGILALLTGSVLALLLCLLASLAGLQIFRHWDRSSSSALQYRLEQRTVLISTLVRWALAFAVLSGPLFVYTLDDLHPLFVGAMCATGTLNANPVGWHALTTKLAVFLAAALWLVVNGIDARAEDFPLVRVKYALLPLVAYLVGLDLYYQLVYFSGLQPEVITSCCGSLFSSGSAGLAADLAGLPVVPTMIAFYAGAAVFAAVLILPLVSRRLWTRLLPALAAAAFLPLALAAVISFISLYVYQLPTHHCPFDLLQGHYHFIGYPLFLSLFAAIFYGLLPGLLLPLRRISALRPALDRSEGGWLLTALVALLIFLALSSAPIIFSEFSLLGYDL
jgi:hypothetical protein